MSGECPNCGDHTMECMCLLDRPLNVKYCKNCKNEKIACSCLGKTLDLAKKKDPKTERVNVDLKDLIELIYWARRYCDNRATYAPFSFNQILKRIRSENQSVIMADTFDQTLKDGGMYWPFAQDSMYNAQNGAYDATI